MMTVDFLFLEFFVFKKYNQKLEEYFLVGKQTVSTWRTTNKVPSSRLVEFYEKEGTLDPQELFSELYPK